MRTVALPAHRVWGVWEPTDEGVISIALKLTPDAAKRMHAELIVDGLFCRDVVLINADEATTDADEFDAADKTGAATAPRPVQAGGFTGQACPVCGQFAMRRTGPCSTCQACGHNSECE